MLQRLFIAILLLFPAACAPQEWLPTQAALPAVPIRLLNFWQTEVAALTDASDVHLWQFVASPGDEITLRALGRGTSVVMTLQDAAGRMLASGDDISTPLAEGGVYSVVVRPAGSTGGVYEIGLGYVGQPHPENRTPTPLPQVVGVPTLTPYPGGVPGTFISSLVSGEVAGSILPDGGPAHLYNFEGRQGQYIEVSMGRISGTVDPLLTLYDPEGQRLAMDGNSGGGRAALLRNIRLPVDGTYTVQAAGGGFPGSYSLIAHISDTPFTLMPETSVQAVSPTPLPLVATPTLGPALPGMRLVDHVPLVGTLARAADFGQFSLFAAEGETVSISVSPHGGGTLRPQIELYGPDGALIASARSSTSGDAGSAFLGPLQLPFTGSYIVFVSGEDGSVGNYLVSYGSGLSSMDVYHGLAESNTRIEGALEHRGRRDVWTVYLNAGDVISAAVSPGPNSLDPVIELALADGTLIASDSTSGGGRAGLIAMAEITESGLYLLRVRDATAEHTGAYTMVWRYINLAPTPTPPPNAVTLLSIDGTVADGEYNFYVFQGQAGQRVRVRVLAKPGTTFDPVAALLGPDGQIIAEGDDSEGDLNPRFMATLPQDGTYAVRVNGYLVGGDYEVIVELLF